MFLLALLAGCTPETADTSVTLPPEETDIPRDTDPVDFPEDTSLDSDLDVAPVHTLTMHQFGWWDVTPDAMTGTLRYQEYVDDGAPNNDTADTDPTWPLDTELLLLPICDLTITLAGPSAATVPTCAGCETAYEITFTYRAGDVTACHDNELPLDGATRVMAFNPTDQQIYMNFGNIDLWLPWYGGTRTLDRVTFNWLATVGVSIDDMMGN